MNEDELRRGYGALREQRRLGSLEPGAAPRPAPEALWSALDGTLEPGERVRILDEALRTGGSDEVAMAQAMHTAAVGAAGTANVRRTPAASRRWWPVAVAAALLVTVSVPLLRGTGETPVASTGDMARFREGGTGAPMLVAPSNDTPLGGDTRFVWRPVADAREYVVEALDAEGSIVARVVTTDTTASLPATLSAAERARVTGWWVTASTGGGASVRSELRLVAPVQRP